MHCLYSVISGQITHDYRSNFNSFYYNTYSKKGSNLYEFVTIRKLGLFL